MTPRSPVPESLDGARVLVTGATSGLGRAMAEALAAGGARVGVTSRSRERAEATAGQLGPAVVGFVDPVEREPGRLLEAQPRSETERQRRREPVGCGSA
jgi:NAD(P)-dependent dehydrogenase (short-subunit alcohol dehydrogenase family)